MATIRELFHEIGNWHNKISVGAGVTKQMLQYKPEENSIHKIKKDLFVKRLAQLEQYAVGADKVLNRLKDIIYSKVDPDTGKPKK